jgi:hypothetical protein
VSVGPEGHLTDLRLDEGIRHQPAALTAQRILTALKAAKADLVEQFAQATAETLGADSAAGLALTASLRNRLDPPVGTSDEVDRERLP